MKAIVALFSLSGALIAGALLLVRPSVTAGPAPEEKPLVLPPAPSAPVVKSTGVIKPCVGAEVRVGSRVSGVVRRLYVKVGDRVEKGQLLAELDDRDLAARCDQAWAESQRARAELRYAQSDLQRKRELRGASVIAPSELDVADRACAVAEQNVAVAQAALVYAETQVGYARIEAPISGVVASVSTQEGETVSASLAAPTFVTLIDLTRLEVWAYVDETDIGRVREGQAARFTVDTYGDEEFQGQVTTIYPKAEIRDNVVDYVTVVQFAPPAGRILRPEMTTTVRIALASPSAPAGANASAGAGPVEDFPKGETKP